MPDVEEFSLIFVSDHAVWISWQHADERHAPTLKHTNDVIASYVTAIRISIDWKKRPSTATLILSYMLNQEANPGL